MKRPFAAARTITPRTASKVFTGKAVIAELRGTGTGIGDMVTWKTSDPASGTEVSYRNDGTANTGYVSGQVEPLGQSVALTDPEPPNEPTQYPASYEQYLFSARESEWECKVSDKFYGGFQGMPDHCQKKRLMDLRIPLAQTFNWDPFKTQPCEESNDPETISVCTETTRDPADKRFEAGYAGDEFKSNGVTYVVGRECIDALAVTHKEIPNLKQAWDNVSRITNISRGKGVGSLTLMAIGTRESGAGSDLEEDGGKGTGWYQIDLGEHPNVTVAQAMDFDWATAYVSDLINDANRMISNYQENDRKRHRDPSLTYSADQRRAMMFRIYNKGSVSPAMRDKLRETDDPRVLDPGTALNNYVSNLVNLQVYCFSGAKIKEWGF